MFTEIATGIFSVDHQVVEGKNGIGDGAMLEASLARLADQEIEILVPGHGPVIAGRARVRDWVA